MTQRTTQKAALTMTTMHRYCSNCGGRLTADQIAAALEDASLAAGDEDNVTFCCSSYADEDGCQGNDETLMAYWYTR